MSALSDRFDDDHSARLEFEALVKMVSALCRDIDQLARDADARGALATREADMQSQAFAERREQARALLQTESTEPYEIQITRLEKMVDALSTSREFFRTLE